MLRKILILTLLFHFGEFTNIERAVTYLANTGSKIIQYVHIVHQNIPPSISSNGQAYSLQANQFQHSLVKPSVSERFDSNDRADPQYSVAPTNPDSFFVPNQPQFPQYSQNPQQSPYPQQSQYPQQPQQPQNTLTSQNNPSNQIQQNAYAFSNQNQGNQINSNQKYETTSFRTTQKFDRTSMISSEESSQTSDQRPNSNSFGDQNFSNNNKNSQDETSSTYPNENSGFSHDQVPPKMQYIENYNKPDENAIVIPNVSNNDKVEIILPPTLSYDDDVSTTTRASIFDSSRRRSTTTEYTPSYV